MFCFVFVDCSCGWDWEDWLLLVLRYVLFEVFVWLSRVRPPGLVAGTLLVVALSIWRIGIGGTASATGRIDWLRRDAGDARCTTFS